MADRIPNGITRGHILAAIRDLDARVRHPCGPSVFYDVLYENRRYPPKALIGIAAGKLTGKPLGPHDFKGGIYTICVRVLRENGFQIITKVEHVYLAEKVDLEDAHIEGAVAQIIVNRRDALRCRRPAKRPRDSNNLPPHVLRTLAEVLVGRYCLMGA